MILYRTNKIAEPEKILKINEKLDKIGNRYKSLIGKEINDYAKKIGFSMLFSVIIDLKLVGKTKDEAKLLG
jgi:tetrahydromethanopterin S-methyltransferase subunit G